MASRLRETNACWTVAWCGEMSFRFAGAECRIWKKGAKSMDGVREKVDGKIVEPDDREAAVSQAKHRLLVAVQKDVAPNKIKCEGTLELDPEKRPGTRPRPSSSV